MLILLRGAPGAGKSTVARLVVEAAGRGAVVEVDDLRGDLWHVPPALALSDAERHHVALAQAARAALLLLGAGVAPVVVVDTFSSAALAAFLGALRGRAEARAVTLAVGRAEHARRLRERPEVPGVYRDAALASAMDAELRAAGPHLDTTGRSPRELAEAVLASGRAAPV